MNSFDPFQPVDDELPKWKRLDSLLRSYVIDPENPLPSELELANKIPGCVVLVSRDGDIPFYKSYGCKSVFPVVTPLTRETVFDVASLTKPFVTTLMMMLLVDNNIVDLDSPISEVLDGFSANDKGKITFRHLLSHSSGLPAHSPIYKKIELLGRTSRYGILKTKEANEVVLGEVSKMPLVHMPGRFACYSDLGFMLLGMAIEKLCGNQSLATLFHHGVSKHFGLRYSSFVDLESLGEEFLDPVADLVATTAKCPWRRRYLCGEVHDENTWAVGGIAGQAGLFSTARDLNILATELLNCYLGTGKFISQQTMRTFWQRDAGISNSTWALGWDTPSASGSSSGDYFSRNAVGHLGFTGCSVWIDIETRVIVVMLTNRVNLGIENKTIKILRPKVHNAIMEELELDR